MATTVVPSLRTSDELVKRIQRVMRDRDQQRWTEREILMSINEAAMMWRNRVSVPLFYLIPGGWQVGIYEYPIPSYINARTATPQVRSLYPYEASASYGNSYQWSDLSSYTIEPDAGGQLLRIDTLPDHWDISSWATNEARMLWYGHNGPLPEVDVKLVSDMTDSDTSAVITVSDTNDDLTPLHDYGFVKIGDEWMQYAGAARTSTVTIQNLQRAVFGTTAAAHSADDAVLFGLAATDDGVFLQLEYHIRAALHRLFLTDASDNDTAHHERMMQYYQDLADGYWMTYTATRSPKIVAGRRSQEITA